MAFVQFHKVTSLPQDLEPDSIYYVLLGNGLHVDTIVTDDAGNGKSAGVALIDARVTTALEGLSIATAEIVPDIEARDAFIAGLSANQLILVMDATDDAEVASGSALYIYEHGNAQNPGDGDVHRVPGFSGVNVSMAWANITGKPTSTPGQIDAAVAASHSHTNAAVLGKFSEVSGSLLYDGSPIEGGGGPPQWDATDW
jgi:hypothetical protein